MNTTLALTFVAGIFVGSGPSIETIVTCLTVFSMLAILVTDYRRVLLQPARSAARPCGGLPPT